VKLSAVIRKEGNLFVSWCPELDVASQGKTEPEALANLREAVELYLEDEHARAPGPRAVFTTFEVGDGEASGRVRA
jgi:predicted RNase H-like HicB family nuclease